MKRLFPLALLAILAFAGTARGQAYYYSQPVINSSGLPVPGANVAVCTTLATTAAAVSNDIATLTMASNPITAGYAAGGTISVSGFTSSDTYFNGSWTVLTVSSVAITYSLTHANASAGTNGVVVEAGTQTTACAPLATIYVDQTGTTAAPNPFTADGFGNFSFWSTTGLYFGFIYGPNVGPYLIPITSPVVSGGSSGSCPAGSSDQIQFNSSGDCGGDAQLTWNSSTHELFAGPAVSSFSSLMQNTILPSSSKYAFGSLNTESALTGFNESAPGSTSEGVYGAQNIVLSGNTSSPIAGYGVFGWLSVDTGGFNATGTVDGSGATVGAYVYGNGNVAAALNGIESYYWLTGTGTVGRANGHFIDSEVDGGTLTNGNELYIAQLAASGSTTPTVTNHFGINIDDMGSCGGTHATCIFTNPTAAINIGNQTGNAIVTGTGKVIIGDAIQQPGSSSGTITFQPQAAAGTYNWNWPTTAGTSGQVLTSGGGGSNPMIWSTPSIFNPGTTTGDSFYCTNTSTPCTTGRLGIGATGAVYQVVGGIPAWNTKGINVRGIGFTIGTPGGTLTAAGTTTDYITVPFACTITGYDLAIDAGTITVKFWKVATGTAIPTSSNSISTSGVGISSGTAIHSTTVTDFTTTTVAADDIVAMNVSAVSSAGYVNGVLECTQ